MFRVALCATLPGPVQAQIKPLSMLATRGGTPQTGTYTCRQQYNQAGYSYQVIEFNSPDRYHWVRGGKSSGAMQAGSRSGRHFRDSIAADDSLRRLREFSSGAHAAG